jgi:hypothetical protein
MEVFFLSFITLAKSCWGKLSVSRNLQFRALEEMATKCLMLEMTPQNQSLSIKHDSHSFNRDGEKRRMENNGPRRPFHQELGHERRSFNRDGQFEHRSFNREERRPFNRDGQFQRRSFNRDGQFERRPFNRNSEFSSRSKSDSESKLKFKHTFESR